MTNTVIDEMTAEEAQAHVAAINSKMEDIGALLFALRLRAGWRALGYPNWTAFLEGEFEYSRKHLYELMHAATVAPLLPPGTSTKAKAALASFDVALQPTIAMTATARYSDKPPTESQIRRVGEVIQTMAVTGHVDTGNGTSTPVEAALNREDEEADARRKQYQQERGQWEQVTAFEAAAKRIDDAGAYLEDSAHSLYADELQPGRQYRVVVFGKKVNP